MRQQAPVEHGVGSGVIVSSDGNILTNNHVVDSADQVTVTLADHREFTAKVVGTDPETDLAVVHIDATGLPALALGDSDKVRVGDVVLAIGNPLDVGETVTMGIISAKGRTTENDQYQDFLQTDAPINEGNSGGPLITAAGELIGINSQIETSNQLVLRQHRHRLRHPVEHGQERDEAARRHRPRAASQLGVTVQVVNSNLAKSLGLSTVHGALVNSVEPGSPAAKAGLKQGDVIVKLNGNDVSDSNDLRNRISQMTPGTSATLGINRDGTERQITATLDQKPTLDNSGSKAASSDTLGLTLQSLTPSLARQVGVSPSTQGLVVTDVDPSGAGARAGLTRGDVIEKVNGQAVNTVAELHAALAASPKPGLTLFLHHTDQGDQTMFTTLPSEKK